MHWWVLTAGWTVARAQEPAPAPEPAPEPAGEDAPVALEFNSDRVLVTTFQAQTEAAQADADRLFEALSARMRQSNDVIPMADVPFFEVHGYDGAAYLRGCPPDKYAGCVLVIGERGQADRAVGATVHHEPDEFDPAQHGVVITVHIVDIREAREVASFGLPVPAGREDVVLDGVARVYDDVVKGLYELQDLREGGEDASAEALAARREDIVAQSLAELESELGTAIRADQIGLLDRPRLRKEDLDQYGDRDDIPPWERLNLSEATYLRFANSGMDIDTWRDLGWGRFGKILLRAGAGFGSGPWSQSYAGEVLLSDDTLLPVDAVQVLEVRNAGAGTGDFEVGFGVSPFAEVMFAAGVHTGSTTYAFDEDVQGQVAVPGRSQSYAMSSWQLGARVGFAPFPRWPARPTLGAGLAQWTGSGIPEGERFDRLDAPRATMLELLPGAEVDASPAVALAVRFVADVPLGGVLVRQSATGSNLIEGPPTPTGDSGAGFTVQASLLVRVGPLFRPDAPETRQFDDDP